MYNKNKEKIYNVLNFYDKNNQPIGVIAYHISSECETIYFNNAYINCMRNYMRSTLTDGIYERLCGIH